MTTSTVRTVRSRMYMSIHGDQFDDGKGKPSRTRSS